MTMIQVRNVPEELHRSLKAKAALAGLSLSDFILNELRALAERPSLEELVARIAAREAPDLPMSPTDAVRAERESR